MGTRISMREAGVYAYMHLRRHESRHERSKALLIAAHHKKRIAAEHKKRHYLSPLREALLIAAQHKNNESRERFRLHTSLKPGSKACDSSKDGRLKVIEPL